ncbi:hypothetical protein EIQ06_12970 [Xanthomonas campestris pv. campestris]
MMQRRACWRALPMVLLSLPDMMSGKRKTQQMSALYCRSYLATLGVLVAGVSGAFAALAGGSVSAEATWLALLVCLAGVLLVAFGLFGPSRQMESWAEATSSHDVALVLMVLAFPVYLLLKPFYKHS